jgi:hypothetical protein
MTTITDERIRGLLIEAANEIEPSRSAKRAILDAATPPVDDDDDAPARPSRARTARAVLAVAAAVLVASAAVIAFGDRHHTAGPPTNLSQPALGTHSVQGGPAWSSMVYGSAQNGQNGSYAAPNLAPTNVRASGLGNTGLQDANGTSSNQQPSSVPTSSGAQPARVVATGTITMTVSPPRLQAVVTSMSAIARKDGGYVASAVVHTRASGGVASATVVLRVPEHQFTSLVAAVQHEGTTTSVATNSSDVTGEVVDYQSRIAAAEASRRQYLAILAKAGSISAILSVQSQINQIQSEIEQLQGARNVLVNEAAYSTLSVSINRSTTAHGPESGIRHSWLLGVGGFVAAFELLIRAAGPTLFILLCLAIIALVGRAVWRATRRRML